MCFIFLACALAAHAGRNFYFFCLAVYGSNLKSWVVQNAHLIKSHRMDAYANHVQTSTEEVARGVSTFSIYGQKRGFRRAQGRLGVCSCRVLGGYPSLAPQAGLQGLTQQPRTEFCKSLGGAVRQESQESLATGAPTPKPSKSSSSQSEESRGILITPCTISRLKVLPGWSCL